MGSNPKEPVCVTGANGFIGSWVVKTLLEQGYTSINASILPGTDAAHLLKLPGATAPGVQLRVFEADILDPEAMAKSIEGCKGVFHLASPNTLGECKDPEKELVIPAVQGTINVLEASKNAGVRRVVVTSSISSLVPNPSWPENKPYDEDSWTDTDFCKSNKIWYSVSKTLAEKAAWEYSEKTGLDVVAIHPATSLGPFLQPGINASGIVLLELLQGSQNTQEHYWVGCVHVKDVARAQILLLETPAASGRFLCTNGSYQFAEFAEKVSKLFPEYPVHKFTGKTQPGLTPCKDAAKKLLGIGMVFTPIEDAVKDTVQSLVAGGFLKQANAAN